MSIVPGKRKGSKVSSSKKPASKKAGHHDNTDLREQLYNKRERGPIEQVQLPEAMITLLHGLVLDFDPQWFAQGTLTTGARKDPAKFYKKFVRKFLRRHPVFAKAEVRCTGQGVHVILWFAQPVEFLTDADRQRWAAIVKVIQKLLPTDPDCPGITALTRPIGSVNGKNDATVTQLQKGEPVSVEEVLGLFNQACSKPFHTVATLLFGSERVTPCPVCEEDDTRLDALDRVGKCYGGCGKVSLGQLFDVFLKPRADKKGG